MKRREIQSHRRLLRRFRHSEGGATAVEFALIAAPFFWLILVIFETAAVLFTDIALQNGVTQTARLIRTGQVQTQNISQAAFRAILCKNVASYIDCSKIRLDISKSADLPITGVDMMTVPETTPQKWEVGTASQWVLVQASYDWKLFVPGISQLANLGKDKRRLTAGALFRNEPYGG